MKVQAIAFFLYGLLILIGGVIGHFKANSVASLVAGTLFGILAIACAILIYNDVSWGYLAGVILTLFLLLFFLYRFSLSYRFMPAGLMVLLSFVMILIQFFWRRR